MALECPSEIASGSGTGTGAIRFLHESIAAWFTSRFPEGPTQIQREAWPTLARGGNLLLSAPTGAGKTHAVLLPVLSDFARTANQPVSPWRQPSLFALYLTPLRALANDIERGLRRLSEELPTDVNWPTIGIRTGDSSASARRQLRDCPPDLLVSTPESVAILLSQPAFAPWFRRLRWVIVDEVHELAASKRGADLALSLERIDELAGGMVRRVGLSATATPLDEASRFLVGTGRSCEILSAGQLGPLELSVEPLPDGPDFLRRVAGRLRSVLCDQRAVLVFANTRRLAERLGWVLRHALPELDGRVAVHHSSLAAERRRAVEEQFKRGELRVVVSSTSLELGIDIGAVDLAVLIHPPGDVVRLLQRVGRAGHGPGRVRRGLVLASRPAELLEAAVTAASGRAGQCEPLRIPSAPLDVLCQHLVSMAGQRAWSTAEAFALVRRAHPYRQLSEQDFRDCLDYLLGRDAEGRDWLPARLIGDSEAFSLRPGRTARLLRRNLGTIHTEPGLDVRIMPSLEAQEESQLVGQVDVSFGDRLAAGDRFLLDGRCLEVCRREGDELRVREVIGRPAPPRWDGSPGPLSAELARRLYQLRVEAAEALRDGPVALASLLRHGYRLDAAAVAVLSKYFQCQEIESEIPDANVLLVECVGDADFDQWYLHTPLSRAGNDALARVAVHRLVRDLGRSSTSIVADLGLVLQLRGTGDEPAELVRTLLAPERFLLDFDRALADSDTLRAQFGRVAQTGLMVLGQPLGGRRRVGGQDWAARRLFDQVRRDHSNFVLLRQAAREVAEFWCDAPAAEEFASSLSRRAIRVRRLSRPSPFADGWTQQAVGPVEDCNTPAEALQRLHSLLHEREAHASAG